MQVFRIGPAFVIAVIASSIVNSWTVSTDEDAPDAPSAAIPRGRFRTIGRGTHGKPASTRTTQLCDRRRDELSLDEVERIVI